MSLDGKEPKRGSIQSFFRSSFKKKEGWHFCSYDRSIFANKSTRWNIELYIESNFRTIITIIFKNTFYIIINTFTTTTTSREGHGSGFSKFKPNRNRKVWNRNRTETERNLRTREPKWTEPNRKKRLFKLHQSVLTI